ncbi:MAG: PepSY-associated TM helix domain-containing protein [Bacteroidota bacterium]
MKSKTVIYTRLYRKLHRNVGVIFILFFLLVSISGFLLGLKDELGLKPETQTTNSLNQSNWISIKKLDSISKMYAVNVLEIDSEIDRIDIRPDKGIAKVLFKKNFQELQLDLETGEILSVAKRADNFIERLHDGSIIDFYFTESNISTITYVSIISLSLVFMIYSGYLLWANPRKIKRNKKPS